MSLQRQWTFLATAILLTLAMLFAAAMAAVSADGSAPRVSSILNDPGIDPSNSSASSAVAGNLLANPSFEGEYHAYVPPGGHPDCPSGICTTAQMADHWTPWWVSHDPNDPPTIIVMPEYKPAELGLPGPDRVRSGQRAQQYFTFSRTHRAGIYQRVPAVPGEGYCFRIWGHSWSSSDDDPNTSDSTLEQRVGIDPMGGTQWDSPNVVWGPPKQQYNVYGYFDVCTYAQTDHVTVFTFSEPVWAVKHNDVYWDDAELVTAEGMEVHPPGGLTFLADIDAPDVQSAPLLLDIPFGGGHVWNAFVEPGGTLLPALSASSGSPGDDLVVSVDSSGLSLGTYSADITVYTSPATPGSPTTVSVTLVVAQELYRANIPLARRP